MGGGVTCVASQVLVRDTVQSSGLTDVQVFIALLVFGGGHPSTLTHPSRYPLSPTHPPRISRSPGPLSRSSHPSPSPSLPPPSFTCPRTGLLSDPAHYPPAVLFNFNSFFQALLFRQEDGALGVGIVSAVRGAAASIASGILFCTDHRPWLCLSFWRGSSAVVVAVGGVVWTLYSPAVRAARHTAKGAATGKEKPS